MTDATFRLPRRACVAVAAATAAVVLLAAAAWACTNHTGTVWFCTTSTACAANSNAVTSAGTYYANGSALIANRTDIAVNYALASAGEDACHTGTAILTGGVTNGMGILTIASVTMPTSSPDPSNYTFCATNGTGDNYSAHRTLSVN